MDSTGNALVYNKRKCYCTNLKTTAGIYVLIYDNKLNKILRYNKDDQYDSII